MIRKANKWMLPFYIYTIIIFILMFIGINLSYDSNARTIWLIFFYLVYLSKGIYIAGFIMGFIVQRRSQSQNKVIQIIFAGIVFLSSLITLPSPTWKFIKHPFINSGLLDGLRIALITAILFFSGEVLSSLIQKHKHTKKEHTPLA